MRIWSYYTTHFDHKSSAAQVEFYIRVGVPLFNTLFLSNLPDKIAF